MSGQSLYDKVWQAHVVREADGQARLIRRRETFADLWAQELL